MCRSRISSFSREEIRLAAGLPLLRAVLPAGAEVQLPPVLGGCAPCESLSDQPGPLASEFETLDLKRQLSVSNVASHTSFLPWGGGVGVGVHRPRLTICSFPASALSEA